MHFKRLCGGAMPAALLLDLDGTLLDSLPDLTTAIDRMLLELGCVVAGEARVRTWVGDGARQLVCEALQYARCNVSDTAINAALQIYQRHYQSCLTDRSRLFVGVMSALQQWQARGIAMACVTNKAARFTEPLIEHFQLRQWLPVVVSGDTLPQRKPHPAPLLLACKQLQVRPERTLMIGDSRNDVLAARAAGMPVVCVDYGYNHGRPVSAEQPDSIVGSLHNLLE